jgi:hypothetical protein
VSTPAADPTMPDPSQVFADPSQMPAMQGGQPQGAPPEQSDQGEQEPQQPGYQHDPIDLEGCIAEAIEAGCHVASAAADVSAEDYMRFSQGVSFLASALKDIQPQPATDPAAAQLAGTALRVGQQHAAAMVGAAKDLHAAQTQHHQQQLQDAQQSVPPGGEQPNRPTPAQSSARG